MSQASKNKVKWIGVVGLALGLPVSLFAQDAPSRAPYATVGAADDAQMPQRWRNYARSSITPQFTWIDHSASDAAPHVTDLVAETMSLSVVLSALGSRSDSFINLSVATATIDHRAQPLSAPVAEIADDLPRIGLQRTVIAPSYMRQWGATGSFGFTAVLAYQRFVSLGMGEMSLRDGVALWPMMPGETSYGGGMRFDVGNLLGERLSWNAAYQSRLNMDAFNNYRGVYLDPGQFDVPANASLGVSYALTQAFSVDFGAQRVMYNDVTPFTSTLLPRRFLALLGSGASPVFAWEDLTVYSAGWTWRNRSIGNVGLRYTSRQQPHPTSALLRSALGVDPADHTVALAYSRATGRRSQFNLQAVYSSAPYFLGVPSYRTSDSMTGDNVEYEARWALNF